MNGHPSRETVGTEPGLQAIWHFFISGALLASNLCFGHTCISCFAGDFPMYFDLYLGGAMAIWLALYLIYALIHPEKF